MQLLGGVTDHEGIGEVDPGNAQGIGADTQQQRAPGGAQHLEGRSLLLAPGLFCLLAAGHEFGRLIHAQANSQPHQ
ncbi:hypothetical protein D3C71_2064560 [compost metagenome]